MAKNPTDATADVPASKFRSPLKRVTDKTVGVPNIISVDDHVVPLPDLWTSRLPSKFRDAAPRVAREKGVLQGKTWKLDDANGQLADVWHFDLIASVIPMESAAAGFEQSEIDARPMTYEEMRPGCHDQVGRLSDMMLNHVDASVNFPDVFPGYCGEVFSGVADKALALACIQVYNDWMIDEWCGGEGTGRLVPLTLITHWDPLSSVAEVQRCAAKGSHAVSFSESPHALGFPTYHSGEWEPFFAACQETGTTVAIHRGSSPRAYTDDPDAPWGTDSTLHFQYGLHSLIDLVISGVPERFEDLNIAYSECEVAWMPYVLERMDHQWERRMHNPRRRIRLSERPSTYVKSRIYGCIIDDEVGIRTRDHGIDIDHLMIESNYPHGNGYFPRTVEMVAELCARTDLTDDEIYKFTRGNAIKAFGLERYGIAS
jgi:predicted TIM-barrel fold metal-dependent hydrolase